MRVTFLSIDNCPNAAMARQRLDEALAILDLNPSIVTDITVNEVEEAEHLGFQGSPSILIDGIDPFAEHDSPVGLSCRIYRADAGVDGAPSVAALTAALRP